MLTLELVLLLDCVMVVLHQSASRRDFKLRDAAVVQLIDGLVEGIAIDPRSGLLELGK